MKPQHFFYCLAIITIIFTACKKDKDYSNKWTGEWDFVVIDGYHHFNPDGPPSSGEDTVYYLGKISLGNADKELNIKYTGTSSIILNVNEYGELSGFPTPYCHGKFEGVDKIHLYLRWGGLGGWSYHAVDGTKKERRKK